MREGEKADDASSDKDEDDEEVAIEGAVFGDMMERGQDKGVFSEQEQDKGAADAGEDHGDDGDESAEEDEGIGIGCGEGDQAHKPIGSDGPEDSQRDSGDGDFFDLTPDEKDTGEDQAKEKPVDGGGVFVEKGGDEFGEGEDGGCDAADEKEQEEEIDVFCEVEEASAQEQFDRGGVEGTDAGDEFFVDAKDQGHRTARYTGDDIGDAHDDATYTDGDVSGEVARFGVWVEGRLKGLGVVGGSGLLSHGARFLQVARLRWPRKGSLG